MFNIYVKNKYLKFSLFLNKLKIERNITNPKFIRCSNSLHNKADNQKRYQDNDHAKAYATFRPTYPNAVFETISRFCQGHSTSRALALDVGCGSGQSSLPLTKHFSRVMGVDVSAAQISHAPTDVPGLAFRVSTAEDLSIVDDSSVDLITVGTALHWIQLDRFYSEVDRVLKPGGSLVAYGYGSEMNVDNPRVQDYFKQIYRETLACYWSPDIQHANNQYANIPSPYGQWLRNNDLVMEHSYSVEQVVGLLESYSFVRAFMAHNPQVDVLGEIREKLSTTSRPEGISKGEQVYKLTWPLFMLMTHKPHESV